MHCATCKEPITLTYEPLGLYTHNTEPTTQHRATPAPADEAAIVASIKRGLAQSAAGRTSDLGDFTQYAKDAPSEGRRVTRGCLALITVGVAVAAAGRWVRGRA